MIENVLERIAAALERQADLIEAHYGQGNSPSPSSAKSSPATPEPESTPDAEPVADKPKRGRPKGATSKKKASAKAAPKTEPESQDSDDSDEDESENPVANVDVSDKLAYNTALAAMAKVIAGGDPAKNKAAMNALRDYINSCNYGSTAEIDVSDRVQFAKDARKHMLDFAKSEDDSNESDDDDIDAL